MRHEGEWAKLKSLDGGWWCANPPTAILEAPNSWAQLLVVSQLKTGAGYRPETSYVMGARLGEDRFYTGGYVPGPVEWVLQLVGRRPKPQFLIGVRVSDDDWADLERLARTIPKVREISDQVESSHILDIVPLGHAGELAGGLLKLLSVLTRVGYSRRGIQWPPVKQGDSWALASPPASQAEAP